MRGDANEIFFILTTAFGIGVSIFWMVCGWRAMQAHERMAQALDRLGPSRADTTRER